MSDVKSDGGAERQEQTKESDLPEITIEQLPKRLQEAAARAGWTKLMPVQAKAMPYVIDRRDVMVQSRTGSGKTGAFLLPILERLDPESKGCQAMILTPTRELASQVASDANILSGDKGIRVVEVYGGVGYGPQIEGFRNGAQLVVGTPGRVLDHLLRRSLSLDNLEFLVFDEADRMLSMGFYPDMKRVQGYLPRRRINCLMFSATFPPNVIRLADTFMHDQEMISLSHDHVHVMDTEHVFYPVPPMKKDRCLARIIEIENPDSAIIFCNTKAQVHYVSVVLKRFGYDADELSADLAQSARERVLARVRAGSLRFLVATDVAARGIDVPELSHVILYEVPEDPESYIHRAGRTGRAGATGEAISLVSDMERLDLMRIAKRYKIDIQERPLPSDEDVATIVSERVTALLEAKLRAIDNIVKERLQRYLALASSLGQDQDERALLAMLLDEYYQSILHAPVEQAEPPKPADDRPKIFSDKKRPRNRTGKRKRRDD